MKPWLKFALIGGLLLANGAALADHRHDNRGWRGHDRHPVVRHVQPYRNHSSDRWSFSLNLGRPYYASPGLSMGWSNRGRNSFNSFYNPRPIVVAPRQPRTVIIENNTYVTPGTTVTYGSVQGATSLFKDRYGNCYERRYDGYGNETRIELPYSACNF
ncbi:MAG TPA: hypothetical protein VNR18_12235 [Hyphomicrobiales bacterium]|nr:hypothetical protein [Hyphomicrobiales bacterium]